MFAVAKLCPKAVPSVGGAKGNRVRCAAVQRAVVRRSRYIAMRPGLFRDKEIAMRIYAIQVASGKEAKVEELIRRFVNESAVGEIFVPRFEAMRRWKGEWHKRAERLTPGYLYVETSGVEKLALQLRRVPAFTKLLGNNEVFIPLNDDEVAWLNAFAGDTRRVIEMSEGIMEGSKVIVLRGPLMGHEAEIKRIDRHRRTAELEIRMLGRVKTIRLGLEIVSKSPEKG